MNRLFGVLFLFFFSNIFGQVILNPSFEEDLNIEFRKNPLDLKKVRSMLVNQFRDMNLRLDYLKKLLELPTFYNDEITKAHVYFMISDALGTINETHKATEYLIKCKDIYLKSNESNYMLCRVYSYLASNYQINKEYSKAVKLYQKVIDESRTKYLRNNAKLNLLKIYIEEKKFDIAEVYIDEVFDYFLVNFNTTNHRNLATPYLYKSYYVKGYNEKLKLVNKGVELMKQRNPTNLLKAYEFRANIHYSFNKYKLAKKDLIEALEIAKFINEVNSISRIYSFLGKIYLKNSKPLVALKYLDSLKNYNYSRVYQMSIDSIYFETYTKLKQVNKAAHFARKYMQESRFLTMENKENAYIEYGKKYQTEKKIKEVELLQKENVIKSLEASDEKNKRYFLTAFSLLVVLLLMIIYYRYCNKKQVANLLREKSEIINKQNIELEKVVATKQKFFSIIAHDLVNPFNAMLGYTELLYNNYKDFSENEKKEFIGFIYNSANYNYTLVKSLLSWARSQKDTIVVKKEQLEIKQSIDEIIKPYLSVAKQKEIKIVYNIDNNLDFYADRNMIFTCIGNILNNAIKFTPQNGVIKIYAVEEEKMIIIYIKDSGIGISKNKLKTFYDNGVIESKRGTNNETGTGFGLQIVKEFMEKQNGYVEIRSITLNGTTVALKLPKKISNH